MKKWVSLFVGMWTLNAFGITVPTGQVQYPTAVIASSSTTSGALATNGMSLVGCQLPAAFTGTQISFTVATTLTGTYQELTNSSGQVKYTVAQGQFIAISPTDFYGVQFFKIVSGSTEAASRNLVCSLKGM
jgi:hypothetical protein